MADYIVQYPDAIFNVNLECWEEKVVQASHERPVIADFWADWCLPCKAIAPNLYRAIDDYKGAVVLAKVEMDEGENMKLAGKFSVRGFPSILLFHNGELKSRFCGAATYQHILNFIKDNVDISIPMD